MATENLTVRIGANISDFERQMSKMQGSLNRVGSNMQNIGGSMTKWITAPAMAAATAVAGITAAFGWERLVGLDTAQAKLKGLGYEAKDVSRISDQVVSAIDGGMTTMAEGVDIAAGALAAGVDEGEELERYIRLVGDAAVGSNRPVAEMAQIFNRVQGGGKLMTQELNMVEEGMPGFSNAMAEHMGVSIDTFREMVTAGEVSSDDFLTVMDDFAGGMAEAYADSWQGMVANTKAYIGIIGENLLGGVFEQSKESIAEFIEFLKSDEVVAWAESAGEALGEAFGKVVEAVKGAIEWFMGLSSTSQKLIGAFAGLAVALGPILMVVGTILKTLTPFVSILTTIFGWVMKLGPVFKALGAAIMFLTTPVGLVIAAIAALVAGFIYLWKTNEGFRDGVIGIWESIKETAVNVFTAIGDFLSDTWNWIRETAINTWNFITESLSAIWSGIVDIATPIFQGIASFFSTIWEGISTVALAVWNVLSVTLAEIWGHIVDIAMPIFNWLSEFLSTLWEGISNAAIAAWDFITEKLGAAWNWISETATSVFTTVSDFLSNIWTGVSNAVTIAWTFITSYLSTAWNYIVNLATPIFNRLSEYFSLIWNTIKDVTSIVWGTISGVLSTVWGAIQKLAAGNFNSISEIIDIVWSAIKDVTSIVWEGIKSYFSTVLSSILEFFKMRFNDMRNTVTTIFNNISSFFSDIWSTIKNTFTNVISSIVEFVTNRWNNIWNTTSRIFNNIWNFLKNTWNTIWRTISNVVSNIFNTVVDGWRNIFRRTNEIFNNIFNFLKNLWSNTWSTVTGFADDIRTGVGNAWDKLWSNTKNMFNNMKNWVSDSFDDMVDGAKKLPGKIGSAIKNMAHKAVEGITSLGRSMGSKMESVVNGVIGGLNKVLKAIGVKEIGTISISTGGGGTATGAASYIKKFSTGTRNGAIASDMLGMVNDRGPGNGRGGATQELIQRDGQMFAPRGKNAIVPLKKGDRIFNGAETQSLMSSGVIPRFSQGTGTEGGNSGKKKGLLGTLKDVVSDVWSYISNPGKAFEAIKNSVTANFDGFDGFAGKMLSGGFKMVTDGIKNFIAKIFKENEGALGSGKGGKWMNYRMTTPYSPNRPVPGYPTSFNGGRHYGIDYGTPIGTPITATTGGRLSSFWNEGGGKIAKLVTGQLRQFFMHMQTVAPNGSVKAGDVIGRSGNSGRWTTGPHVHWQAQKGTDALNRNTINPLKVINGYSNGGIVNERQIAEIAEDGPEAVIPLSTSKRGRANQLYDAVGDRIGRDDSKHYDRMINNQQTQIDQMTQAINVLLGIENKTGFDPGKANKAINKHVDDRTLLF